MQGFRATCLFSGQYNTKGYDTIKDVTSHLEVPYPHTKGGQQLRHASGRCLVLLPSVTRIVTRIRLFLELKFLPLLLKKLPSTNLSYSQMDNITFGTIDISLA